MPRLWIDVIAHVVMGRDKRRYRFVQDTRYGRKVLAESNEIADDRRRRSPTMSRTRLIERERALAADPSPALEADGMAAGRSGWRTVRIFLLGLIVGSCAVFAVLWAAASRIAKLRPGTSADCPVQLRRGVNDWFGKAEPDGR